MIVGVDIGTTSAKAVLFDEKGVAKHTSNILYPLIQDTPDMAEQDPLLIFHSCIRAIKEVADHSKGNIKAVSFSAAMHSVILMDEKHNLLTNSITWADNRAFKYAMELKKGGIGKQIYSRTGTPIHPMTPLSKIIWLRTEKESLFKKAKYIIGVKEYVLYSLFGQLKVDYSTASATGMFNLNTFDWDEQALNVAGITKAMLPEIVDCFYQFKGLKKEFADQMGLTANVPFISGSTDGLLSNLGVNAIEPGVLALTIGTSGAMRITVNKPVFDPDARLFCYALTKDKFIVGGAVNNGGIILRWARDEISKSSDYDELLARVEKVPAGSRGLLFHPYLGGERAPLWDANARGSFFGLTRVHTRDDMCRAVLEGIMFNLNEVLQLITNLAGKPKKIQATGGFARSKFWRQLVADILRADVTVPESYESSCLGAAVLAMKSLGMIKDISDVKNMVGVVNTHKPNPQHDKVYDELIPVWRRLMNVLSSEFESIATFQRQQYDDK